MIAPGVGTGPAYRIRYASLVDLGARALREKIGWDHVRMATLQSPFARAFFVVLEGLDILPAAAAGPQVRPGSAWSRPRVPPPARRGSEGVMAASPITRSRLRRLAEVRPAHGRVLSVFLNLDPSEFPTPRDRATELTRCSTRSSAPLRRRRASTTTSARR